MHDHHQLGVNNTTLNPFFSDTIKKKKKLFRKKKIGRSIEKAVGPIACQCSIEILDCFY